MLDLYISRTRIEAIFKAGKSIEGLMPLAKWNERSVRGKVLQAFILTVFRSLRPKATPRHKGSLADLFHEAASVACFKEADDCLRVETPNKQARLAYKELGVQRSQFDSAQRLARTYPITSPVDAAPIRRGP